MYLPELMIENFGIFYPSIISNKETLDAYEQQFYIFSLKLVQREEV